MAINKNIFPRIVPLSGILCVSIFANLILGDPVILDEDTVVVGDMSERMDAETLYARRTSDNSEAYSTINGQNIKVSCTTARNLDGECKPFGECYPLFKLRERRGNDKLLKNRQSLLTYSQEDRLNKVNDELQNIYRAVSGPCSDFVLQTISKALGHPVPKQNYVCCPMETNYTYVNKPSRPQAPVTSPYANQQCGRYFRADHDNTSNNQTGEQVMGRIVNGRVAGRNEFPWIVALISRNGRQFCAGSLVDANHVLTAAHCVSYMNRGDVRGMRLQIGDHNIYSTSDGSHENRGASNVYYHRAFSMRTLVDDVAIIRLSNGVHFNNNIQPICLTTNSWGWETHTASVAGWGQVSERGQQSSVLRTVNVRIWKQNDCIRRYGGKAPAGITNGMVCSGGQGYDSCKGDSGGPLNVWRNKRAEQLGIVSWGIGCGSYPGVYTRVDMYLNWINKNRN